VKQSLTDAIVEGGLDGRELMKRAFKGLVFNILVNPVMNGLQGAVTNSLGGAFGYSNPSGVGGLSSISSLFTGNSIGSSISHTAYSMFNTPVSAAAGGVGPAAPA